MFGSLITNDTVGGSFAGTPYEYNLYITITSSTTCKWISIYRIGTYTGYNFSTGDVSINTVVQSNVIISFTLATGQTVYPNYLTLIRL